MIKIDDKGLQEYKAEYLKEIKPRLEDMILFVDIKSKYERKLKNLLLKNLETFLIGSISDFDILFDEILNLYSLSHDDYVLFDFLYGTKISNKSKLKNNLEKYNSGNVKILQRDIDLLLDMSNRRKYIESNFTQYYCYFMDREGLKKIFDYEKLIGRTFLRNEILTKINTNVCPYCGRQFITSYNKENILKSTAALDHFYPKSKYPFFALSLFNFIPACNTCNSLMKLSKDFYVNRHLYPFEEGFEKNAEFVIKASKPITDYIRKYDDISIDDDITIDIKMNTSDPEKVIKIENNINTFMLKEVYQIHGDVVKDLLYRLQVYRPQHIKEISNLMKLSKEAVESLAFGKPNEKDILGKLKADILNQYKD